MTRIEEIKRRITNAPLEWEKLTHLTQIDDGVRIYCHQVRADYHTITVNQSAEKQVTPDVASLLEFILNARDDIALLLGEVTYKDKKIDELESKVARLEFDALARKSLDELLFVELVRRGVCKLPEKMPDDSKYVWRIEWPEGDDCDEN